MFEKLDKEELLALQMRELPFLHHSAVDLQNRMLSRWTQCFSWTCLITEEHAGKKRSDPLLFPLSVSSQITQAAFASSALCFQCHEAVSLLTRPYHHGNFLWRLTFCSAADWSPDKKATPLQPMSRALQIFIFSWDGLEMYFNIHLDKIHVLL